MYRAEYRKALSPALRVSACSMAPASRQLNPIGFRSRVMALMASVEGLSMDQFMSQVGRAQNSEKMTSSKDMCVARHRCFAGKATRLKGTDMRSSRISWNSFDYLLGCWKTAISQVNRPKPHRAPGPANLRVPALSCDVQGLRGIGVSQRKRSCISICSSIGKVPKEYIIGARACSIVKLVCS